MYDGDYKTIYFSQIAAKKFWSSRKTKGNTGKQKVTDIYCKADKRGSGDYKCINKRKLPDRARGLIHSRLTGLRQKIDKELGGCTLKTLLTGAEG